MLQRRLPHIQLQSFMKMFAGLLQQARLAPSCPIPLFHNGLRQPNEAHFVRLQASLKNRMKKDSPTKAAENAQVLKVIGAFQQDSSPNSVETFESFLLAGPSDKLHRKCRSSIRLSVRQGVHPSSPVVLVMSQPFIYPSVCLSGHLSIEPSAACHEGLLPT
jgi:hypothetical protein